MARLMPLYDPEDPRWESWRASQRRARMEDEFYRRYYRYGEKGILTRYIITPRGRLAYGFTISDLLALLVAIPFAVAFLWACAEFSGFCWDGYLDAVGY